MKAYKAANIEHINAGLGSKRNYLIPGEYEPHVYVVRVKSTLKKYIGMRVARGCRIGDLGSIYFTSSREVKAAWARAPKDVEVVRLILCASNHDAILLEGKLILGCNAVKDSSYLNKGYAGVHWNYSGMTPSIESREKKSASLKGRVISEEARKRISEATSGEKNHRYGKTHSDERRALMSAVMTGELHPMYGETHSESTRAAIRESVNQLWENPVYRKKHSEGQKKRWLDKSVRLARGRERSAYWSDPGVRAAQSDRVKAMPKKECPFCFNLYTPASFGRWHGENCKLNPSSPDRAGG